MFSLYATCVAVGCPWLVGWGIPDLGGEFWGGTEGIWYSHNLLVPGPFKPEIYGLLNIYSFST